MRSAWRRRSLRRRSCIHGPWTGLRCNHSPLRNNRLSWRRLRRRRWRCLSAGRRSLRCCRRFLRRSRRSDSGCRRMRRRRNHNRRRRCRFFCGRWRRDHRCRRGFLRWRSDDRNLLHCRRCRLGRRYHGRLLRNRRLRSSRSLRLYHRRRRRGRLGRSRRRRRCCRSRKGRRMLLLLLLFAQQPRYIARLGDLREIDLRLDFLRRRSLSCNRAGLGRKMLAHPFSFILLN